MRRGVWTRRDDEECRHDEGCGHDEECGHDKGCRHDEGCGHDKEHTRNEECGRDKWVQTRQECEGDKGTGATRAWKATRDRNCGKRLSKASRFKRSELTIFLLNELRNVTSSVS